MRIGPRCIDRIVQLVGIVFVSLFVLSTLSYALTTWSPGGVPEASPADGNVPPYFLIQGYAGTPSGVESSRIWIDTTVE